MTIPFTSSCHLCDKEKFPAINVTKKSFMLQDYTFSQLYSEVFFQLSLLDLSCLHIRSV
jgi:hypothetical protein